MGNPPDMNRPTPGAAPSETPAPPKKRRRWGRIILLTFLGLLVAGELALRVLVDYDSRFNVFLGALKEWDPERKFRLIPNYKSGHIQINSRGILGPEFDVKEAPGAYRIVTLGDSCSFIPERRPYPRALEDELRRLRPARRIDVINASCPGYDSSQVHKWYEKEIDGYDHDLLIVYVGWNDMGQYNPDGLVYKLDETGYLEKPSLLQRAILHCYLLRSYYFVQGYLQRGRPFDAGPLTPEENAAYADFYPTHFEEHITETIQLARSRQREVLLLNFACLLSPDPTEDEQRRIHFPRGMGRKLQKYLLLKQGYEKALHRIAEKTGTPIIDIEALFPDAASRQVFTDAMHFNVEGAEKIAGKVAQQVAPLIK